MFTTKEVAEATGMTVRQIQYYIERNVVRVQRRGEGRGFSYLFDSDDLIRFMLILEMMRFGLSNERMHDFILNYFTSIKKQANVTKFLKEKLYLQKKHFHLVCEYPTQGEFEEVYGYLIHNPEDPLPLCYFQQPSKGATPGFYGYKFEPSSFSSLTIDIGAIYRKRHDYLIKHQDSPSVDDLLAETKSTSKMKGQ